MIQNQNQYIGNKSVNISNKRKISKMIIVFLLVIVAFFIGLIIGSSSVSNSTELAVGEVKNKDAKIPKYLSQDVDFKLFWQVWDLIKNKYVEKDINETKMFYGAQMGLVASLGDPYSVFLTPEVANNFSEELKGKFEGIGAEIAIKKDRLTIVAPLPNSPAEKSGLQAGDKVLEIDGIDTTNMLLTKAVTLIRGDQGTKVLLKVRSRDGSEKEIEIIRDKIHYSSVSYKVLDTYSEENKKNIRVAYIKVSHFNEDTEKLFNQAVNNLKKENLHSLILDLRNNPGGFLTAAISMANNWIDNGVIVKEKSRDIKKSQSFSANQKTNLKNIRTIVLVNGGSASASEIVAGALQDYKLATILGEKTFGKGSVQDLTKLSDGSSLKLTIAKWFTPHDRSISEEGIIPDIEVELTSDDYDNDLDPQLERALELLK